MTEYCEAGFDRNQNCMRSNGFPRSNKNLGLSVLLRRLRAPERHYRLFLMDILRASRVGTD